eukprot:CAMPEP_0172188336 /NCGR_PEP_ID=MMETSP1050-20130122/21858_1 /TAXON_ID=233186 /ORGANISM="Cryptomonas curvata, Strain CCAP979/52" /LENGTH=335 /DNA_ID=CAMNT_0012862801 /DNA_START=83 /DNA_END=1087 /DNA_ORIENTATION=-
MTRTTWAYAAGAVLIASSTDAFAPSAFHRTTPCLLRSNVVPAARSQGGLKLAMNAGAAAVAKNPGLGKGYVSSVVPLANFDAWDAQPPAYAHIPPAPRYNSNDWLSNILNIFSSPMLHRVASHLVANVFFAVLVYFLFLEVPAVKAACKLLSPVAHSLTGAVLGLLLVFRTNSAYARFYDARCIWGQLTNTIREMARLAHTNMRGLDREHALMLTAALPTLMLNHLQSQDAVYRSTQWSAAQKAVLTGLLSEHDFKCIWAARNRPMAAAKMIGAVYRSWFSNVAALKKHFGVEGDRALTDDERAVLAANVQSTRLHMERQLEVISNCYGASERIV